MVCYQGAQAKFQDTDFVFVCVRLSCSLLSLVQSVVAHSLVSLPGSSFCLLLFVLFICPFVVVARSCLHRNTRRRILWKTRVRCSHFFLYPQVKHKHDFPNEMGLGIRYKRFASYLQQPRSPVFLRLPAKNLSLRSLPFVSVCLDAGELARRGSRGKERTQTTHAVVAGPGQDNYSSIGIFFFFKRKSMATAFRLARGAVGGVVLAGGTFAGLCYYSIW